MGTPCFRWDWGASFVEPVVKSVGIALLPVLHLAFVVFVDLATLLAWAFAGGCYVEMHPAPLFYISMLHP